MKDIRARPRLIHVGSPRLRTPWQPRNGPTSSPHLCPAHYCDNLTHGHRLPAGDGLGPQHPAALHGWGTRMARRDMSPSHRASWCFPGVAGRRAVEEERTCHFCCGNGQDLLRKGTLVSYRGGSGMDTLTTSIVSALHDLLLPCTARLWYWRCASSLLDLPLRILEARHGGCGGKEKAIPQIA